MQRSKKLTARVGGLACLALAVVWQMVAPVSWLSGLGLERGVSANSINALDVTVFAVTSGGRLISFSATAPGTIITSLTLTSLPPGESIVGIDFRPATGQLYGLSSANKLYTINTATGAVSPVSGAALAVSGTAFGFDFNPTVDRIRGVSDTDQNFRLNPLNGSLAATDTALAFAAGDANAGANPNVVGSAYTNNFAGATTTTLYGIDSNLDVLVRQGSPDGTPNSPNGGQLSTVGPLGVNTGDQVGFDIEAPGGVAYASLTAAGANTSSLYIVNLATGAATPVGAIGGGEAVRGIALVTRVEVLVALTSGNNLVFFNSRTPGTTLRTVGVTGLQPGESLLGIDARPATGQLYALGSSNRIYTINPVTGAASQVGSATLSPALTGAAAGFDFNPVTGRIAVVNDARQNLRINPDTGAVVANGGTIVYAGVDTNAGKIPRIVGAAYTNNTVGGGPTTLYEIDSTLDILVIHGSPGGTPFSSDGDSIFTVGALGVDTGDQVGFDVSDSTGTAYASLTAGGATSSSLYTVNLTTGAATLVGAIGGTETVRGLAVLTGFVPSAADLGFVAVNAASFRGDTIASNELASLFGVFQTTNGQAFTAPAGPLPTTLGGISVTINGVAAGLSYASNGQINLLTPPGLPDGPVTAVVTNANGTTSTAVLNVARVAPGLFAVRTSGQAVAAAFSQSGSTVTPVFNNDGSPRPIDPGTAANPTYLLLFGTGIRNAAAANPGDANGVAEAVTVTVQGVPATVTYAGAQGTFEGLDQVNLIIPPELAGAGLVQVRLAVNGQVSNTVVINLGGTTPAVRFQTVSLGQTVAGQLTNDDQVQIDGFGDTFFFDAYRFSATAGTTLAIDLRAALFDPLVLLYRVNADGSRTLIADDDDLGGFGDGRRENGNSLLLHVVQQTGNYEVFVTSSDFDVNGTGAYTLRLGANAIQQIAYGQTVNGVIAPTDVQTSAGDLLDAYYFAGAAGDSVQIALSSPSFDPFLLLNLNTGELIDFDDNGGGGFNSRLALTLPETGVYVIIATPFAPGVTGAYTLSLTRGGARRRCPPRRGRAASGARSASGRRPSVPRVRASRASRASTATASAA
jgi:uncharacterized protein (TIGR03437 family)